VQRRVRQRRQHDVAIPSQIAVARNDRARVRPSATDTSVRLPTVDAPTGRVLSMTQSLAAQRGSTAGCAEALVDSRSGRGSDVVRPSTHRRYRSAKLGEIVAKRSRFTPLLESTSCGNRPVRRANPVNNLRRLPLRTFSEQFAQKLAFARSRSARDR